MFQKRPKLDCTLPQPVSHGTSQTRPQQCTCFVLQLFMIDVWSISSAVFGMWTNLPNVFYFRTDPPFFFVILVQRHMSIHVTQLRSLTTKQLLFCLVWLFVREQTTADWVTTIYCGCSRTWMNSDHCGHTYISNYRERLDTIFFSGK